VKKSEILFSSAEKGIFGIPVKQEVKFLCVTLNIDIQKTKLQAERSIMKNLRAFKIRLRGADLRVKKALVNAYARSLLINFDTPIVAGDLWRKKDI
jgi:hypothetical protein